MSISAPLGPRRVPDTLLNAQIHREKNNKTGYRLDSSLCKVWEGKWHLLSADCSLRTVNPSLNARVATFCSHTAMLALKITLLFVWYIKRTYWLCWSCMIRFIKMHLCDMWSRHYQSLKFLIHWLNSYNAVFKVTTTGNDADNWLLFLCNLMLEWNVHSPSFYISCSNAVHRYSFTYLQSTRSQTFIINTFFY